MKHKRICLIMITISLSIVSFVIIACSKSKVSDTNSSKITESAKQQKTSDKRASNGNPIIKGFYIGQDFNEAKDLFKKNFEDIVKNIEESKEGGMIFKDEYKFDEESDAIYLNLYSSVKDGSFESKDDDPEPYAWIEKDEDNKVKKVVFGGKASEKLFGKTTMKEREFSKKFSSAYELGDFKLEFVNNNSVYEYHDGNVKFRIYDNDYGEIWIGFWLEKAASFD